MYFDPCHARATVVRARFLAASFSDGSYLAHVNGAYLRHVTFCIVRGPPLFIVSPICQRGPASVRGPLPTVTVPGWSKVHDGEPLVAKGQLWCHLANRLVAKGWHQTRHNLKNMNPKNSKKSPIHENADANITCDFGDGDISRSMSFLSTTGLNHVTHKQTHINK